MTTVAGKYRGRAYRSGSARIKVNILFDDETSVSGSGSTATSSAVYIGESSHFSVHIIENSGTLDAKVEYLLCSTESGTYLTPSGAADIVTNSTVTDIVGFSPELAPFMKIKVTGNAGNSSPSFDLLLMHQ